jgi:hypothetical protein
MCFVAEKDVHRRNAVFDDVDTKNGAWTDLVTAALKPVNAVIEAAKKTTNAADAKTRARAAREFKCAPVPVCVKDARACRLHFFLTRTPVELS